MQPSVLTQTPRQLYRQISWFWTRPSTSLPFVRSSPLFTQIAKFPLPVSSPPLCPHFPLIFVSFYFISQIALLPFFFVPASHAPSLFIASRSVPSCPADAAREAALTPRPFSPPRVGGGEAAHGAGDALAHGHGGRQPGGDGERGSALKETPID